VQMEARAVKVKRVSQVARASRAARERMLKSLIFREQAQADPVEPADREVEGERKASRESSWLPVRLVRLTRG